MSPHLQRPQPRQDAEQGGLAAAVGAHEHHAAAGAHLKGQVPHLQGSSGGEGRGERGGGGVCQRWQACPPCHAGSILADCRHDCIQTALHGPSNKLPLMCWLYASCHMPQASTSCMLSAPGCRWSWFSLRPSTLLCRPAAHHEPLPALALCYPSSSPGVCRLARPGPHCGRQWCRPRCGAGRAAPWRPRCCLLPGRPGRWRWRCVQTAACAPHPPPPAGPPVSGRGAPTCQRHARFIHQGEPANVDVDACSPLCRQLPQAQQQHVPTGTRCHHPPLVPPATMEL